MVFPDPVEAVAGAAEAQGGLASGPIRVRMGLYTGTPPRTDEGYVGADVHKGPASPPPPMAAGRRHQGGSLLLDEPIAVLDLGEHGVKEFATPVRLPSWVASADGAVSGGLLAERKRVAARLRVSGRV